MRTVALVNIEDDVTDYLDYLEECGHEVVRVRETEHGRLVVITFKI